jgi:hypothetical protein
MNQIKEVNQIKETVKDYKCVEFPTLNGNALILVPHKKCIPFVMEKTRREGFETLIVEFHQEYVGMTATSREARKLHNNVTCLLALEDVQELAPFNIKFQTIVSCGASLHHFPILYCMSIAETTVTYQFQTIDPIVENWNNKWNEITGNTVQLVPKDIPPNVSFPHLLKKRVEMASRSIIALDSVMQREDVLNCLKKRFSFDFIERPSKPFGDADFILSKNRCILLYEYKEDFTDLIDRLIVLSLCYDAFLVIIEITVDNLDCVSIWFARVLTMIPTGNTTCKLSTSCDVTCELIAMEKSEIPHLETRGCNSQAFLCAFPTINWFKDMDWKIVIGMNAQQVQKEFDITEERARMFFELLHSKYQFHKSPTESSSAKPSPKRITTPHEEEPKKKMVKRNLFETTPVLEISLNRSIDNVDMMNITGPKASSMRAFPFSPKKIKK